MPTRKSFFKSPLFWGLHCLVFLAGVYFSIHYYPEAFPVIDLNIKMDRTQALESAKSLALANRWAPENFQQAASFDSDQSTQTFIELEAGGKKRFSQVIQEKLYSPYTWTVRHFKEGSIDETLISFTPEGQAYGFRLSLPETLPGAALRPEEALKIAERAAEADWKIRLSDFQLVAKSSDTKSSKRIDHLFTYELKNQSLGVGKFRLELSVAGDRLSGVQHSVKVPDAFTRKYGEMRSANNTIASMASAAMLVLYLIGGCSFGIFYLARKRWLLWKPSLIAAAIIALFQGLEKLNQLPLAWMQYDTAIPKTAFILKSLLTAKLVFLSDFLILAVSFMAAEGLGRLAFPKHPQLWRIWNPRNSSTYEIVGRTVGGYLAVGAFFSYVIAVYIVGSKLLGWWSPSDVLFQPDALASYLPWFTSISQSLHAGFWEESLFRAVPLSCAALIGSRYGRKNLWMVMGFVIQALIFASAHANYPAQPSYARVVELILPSIFFGLIYINFGLLPGIILHFTFDVISFAIPLFVSSSPRIWIDQSMVALLTLVPLAIVIYSRWLTGRWTHLERTALNEGWIPVQSSAKTKAERSVKKLPALSENFHRGIQFLGLISIIFSLTSFLPKSDTWELNVTRDQAIQIAKTYWKDQLNADWEPQARLVSLESIQDQMVWKTTGPTAYHNLIGTYLSPPAWSVRFVRFNVSAAERAESYLVVIAKDQKILGSSHIIPEERELKSLTEEQARTVALNRIENKYQLKPPRIQEISSSAHKQPHRVDWAFSFRDTEIPLKEGETRISAYVTGDQATSSSRYVFTPENWVRQERGQKTPVHILNVACTVVLIVLSILTLIYCVIQWTQKKFDTQFFKRAYFFFFALGLILMVNSLPSSFATFSTVEPKFNQLLNLYLFDLIKTAITAFLPAVLFGTLLHRTKQLSSRSFNWKVAGTGLSLGIIFHTLLDSIRATLPKESPEIPGFQALTGYSPPLFGFQVFEQFCFFSLTLLFLREILGVATDQWTRKIGWGFAFILFLSLAFTGSQSESFREVLTLGGAGALLLSLSIYFPLRDDPRIILWATAAYVALSQYRQILIHPYPEVTAVALASILLVGLGAFFGIIPPYGGNQRSSDRR